MFMSVALSTLMMSHLHCEYLSLLTFYGAVGDYLKTNQLTDCEGVKDIWTGKKNSNFLKKVEMLHASSSSLSRPTFATYQKSVMMSLCGIIKTKKLLLPGHQ